jgi:putative redox protein
MVTAIIGTDRYRTEITTENKSFAADEPGELGGADTAPSPPEYLMSALASCTAITLRMYADRKKLAVNKIKVQVSYSKRNSKACLPLRCRMKGNWKRSRRNDFWILLRCARSIRF